MSLYKAHKPICEIRTPYQDSWGSVLWVSIDNYKEGKTCTAFYEGDRQFHWSDRHIEMKTVFKKAHGMRMKLTNRGQKCKIFMRYRRPAI